MPESFLQREEIGWVMEGRMTGNPSKCSSCFVNGDEVKTFTAGTGFYLCDKCVETCEQIIAELKKYYENLDRKNGRVHPGAAES